MTRSKYEEYLICKERDGHTFSKREKAKNGKLYEVCKYCQTYYRHVPMSLLEETNIPIQDDDLGK